MEPFYDTVVQTNMLNTMTNINHDGIKIPWSQPQYRLLKDSRKE